MKVTLELREVASSRGYHVILDYCSSSTITVYMRSPVRSEVEKLHAIYSRDSPHFGIIVQHPWGMSKHQ